MFTSGQNIAWRTSQNPEKRSLFKAKLEKYLKITKESPDQLQIRFWDESGFSFKVLKRTMWTEKESRRKVSGRRRKGSFSVIGGIHFSDKKRVVDFISKGAGDSFFRVLKEFYSEVKNEWTIEDRDIDDFEKTGPKIVILLDNSSIHQRKDILEKIKQEMPNLILELLPTYSPDCNSIELVWHSAKEFIANRLFESIEEPEALVSKLLNEEELIINWGRKIKNKGNAVNAI